MPIKVWTLTQVGFPRLYECSPLVTVICLSQTRDILYLSPDGTVYEEIIKYSLFISKQAIIAISKQ